MSGKDLEKPLPIKQLFKKIDYTKMEQNNCKKAFEAAIRKVAIGLYFAGDYN